MNKYLESVIENVRTKHANEPEFVQTVEEVLSSLDPVVERHPEYEKFDLLNRLVEPERQFTFRVVWQDDKGEYHTNTATASSSTALSALQRRPPFPEKRILRHHQIPGL